MNLSNIASFQPEQKVNARLAVVDIQVYSYSGGERTKLMLKDEEGTEIEGIGFQDVRNICQMLKIGKTYVFNDVISTSYNDKKQLKLTSFSSVHTSTSKIPSTQNLTDAIKNPEGSFVSLIAVVSMWSENTSVNPRSNAESRRIQISDPTTQVDVLLFNQACKAELKTGDIIALRAKIGSNASVVCFNPPEIIDDTELEEWWKDSGAKEHKRLKSTNFTKIGSITSESIGSRIDVEGVISSSALNSSTTQSGMKKRCVEIVDDSCFSIEATIFGESAESTFNVGDKICVSATVSDWNGISLVVNALHNCGEDTPVNLFSSIQEWWKKEGSLANITSHTISNDIITLEEAINNDNKRVSLKGNLKDGIFTDHLHSAPLECHTSFTSDLSVLDGPAILRNALICKNPTKIVVFRSTIKMSNKEEKQSLITNMLGNDVSIMMS